MVLYRVSKFLADWVSVKREDDKRRVVGEAFICRAVYEGIEKRVKTTAEGPEAT
jgi:hypothetical protein